MPENNMKLLRYKVILAPMLFVEWQQRATVAKENCSKEKIFANPWR